MAGTVRGHQPPLGWWPLYLIPRTGRARGWLVGRRELLGLLERHFLPAAGHRAVACLGAQNDGAAHAALIASSQLAWQGPPPLALLGLRGPRKGWETLLLRHWLVVTLERTVAALGDDELGCADRAEVPLSCVVGHGSTSLGVG